MKKRLLLVLYVFDNLALALLTLGNCKVGETLSSVAWELEFDGRWHGKVLRQAIDGLLWFDAHHCFEAWRTYQRITKATK